jgi:hypothetical protein
MNPRTALLALFAAASWPCLSLAQSANPPPASAPSQSAGANGVVVVAVQPSPATSQSATPVSSLLWIYDTNTKQLMLCNSHIDASFTCTNAVKLSW